jgi:restriction system protein
MSQTLLQLAPHQVILLCSALLIFFSFILPVSRQVPRKEETSHTYYQAQAQKELKQLARLRTRKGRLEYLRGVHHFVFEEMILTALRRRGHRITRNERYTGDGGIDGQVKIKRKLYLIQAKRYSNHISPAHVRDFAEVCRRQRKPGLFIHTGKTSEQSLAIASEGNVEIISGRRLLRLFIKPRVKMLESI